MKILVILLFVAYTVQSEMLTSQTQNSNNRLIASQKTANSIPGTQKGDQISQTNQYQQPQQYYPTQYVQSPAYQHQQQPVAAMVFLTQPVVPQQAILTNAANQLLNYFNTNPHARYQLFQGYQPQQTQIQPYVAQPPAAPAAPAAYTYQSSAVQQHQQPEYQYPQSSQLQGQQQIASAIGVQNSPIYPQQQQPVSVPSQPQFPLPYAKQSYNQGSQYQFPSQFGFAPTTQLSHISTLAHLTAQKYLPPFRGSVSPIITGLENFTPEQQAQIKAQINSGGPITPLQSNAVSPATTSHQSSSQQQSVSTQQSNNSQDFLPSQEDKTTGQDQANSAGYRSQYTKG